jgi:hypothetical protein
MIESEAAGGDVGTRRRGGALFVGWECSVCGERNDRILAGRPWICLACGYHDRDIELESADLSTVEQRAAESGGGE